MTDLLKQKLMDSGIQIEPNFDNQGKLLRNGTQWAIFKKIVSGDHEVLWASFGDWREGSKQVWQSELNGLASDTSVQEELKAKIREAGQEEKEAKEKMWEERALELEKEFDEFSDRISTVPYLTRKQIDGLYGCRVAPNENGSPILIVPMQDVDGKFWNYQRIYSEKQSKGDKFFKKGARIDGLFHSLGVVSDATSVLYIAEGFATAASIYMALEKKETVLVSFNAGNLFHVALAASKKWPHLKIIVCADNDCYTKIQGRLVNIGMDKGRKAAGVSKGELRAPNFKRPMPGLTDFNDLHCAEGLESVRTQILSPKPLTIIEPMILETTEKGVSKKPNERRVCEHLLKFFGDKIVRQDKSLFRYLTTHWVELDSVGVDQIKQMIGILSGHTYSMKDIEQAYRYFYTHAPATPPGVDLFKPNPFVANFEDGTLHLVPEGKAFTLLFKDSSPQDYLTSTLPFCYPRDTSSVSPGLMQMLTNLWGDNEDQGEIHKFIQQLMGAVLTPAFPVIAIFTGRPNSGKSTIIKLILQMVSRENICSVQMCEMSGFNMETMVGKLVNFDTDIDTNKPMHDTQVKKIIDRIPMRVRRKGRVDVDTYIPAVNLFASNSLPKSLDGSSHAYGRRLVIIPTYSFQATESHGKDFEKTLWESEREGILSFAIEGLRDLATRGGFFSTPKSSHAKVKDIENESDTLGQFLDEVKHNEVLGQWGRLSIDEKLSVERPKLWTIFSDWQEGAILHPSFRLGRTSFFQAVASRGFRVKTLQGVRMFEGMGLSAIEPRV